EKGCNVLNGGIERFEAVLEYTGHSVEELLHECVPDRGGVVHAGGLLFLEAPCTQDHGEHDHKKDKSIEPSHYARDRSDTLLCFVEEGEGESLPSRRFRDRHFVTSSCQGCWIARIW